MTGPNDRSAAIDRMLHTPSPPLLLPKIDVPCRLTYDTQSKAAAINNSRAWAGTICEVGITPSVATRLFEVGGCGETIRKVGSVVEQVLSTVEYGPSRLSVSRESLVKTLSTEYGKLLEAPLDNRQPYAFAVTALARFGSNAMFCHGWMGLRTPRTDVETIIIHFILNDSLRVDQNEAVGVAGVNLLNAGLIRYPDIEWHELIQKCLDGLGDRVCIDYLEILERPFAFEDVWSHAQKLHSVGNAPVAVYQGQLIEAGDILHRKPVIILPTNFLTHSYESILEQLQTKHPDRILVTGDLIKTDQRPEILNVISSDNSTIALVDFVRRYKSPSQIVVMAHDEAVELFQSKENAAGSLDQRLSNLAHLFKPGVEIFIPSSASKYCSPGLLTFLQEEQVLKIF